MTPRICFVGDSHIAALRQGLNAPRGAVHKDRITMFGSRGTGLKSSFIRDGELTSDNPVVRENLGFTGGSASIRLDEYDVFCVVGGQVKMDLLDSTLEDCAPLGMRLAKRAPISSSLLDRLFEEKLKISLGYHLARLLHTTGKPIYLIENPRHSEGILRNETGAFYNALIEAGSDQDYQRRFTRALDAVFGTFVRIIAPPASLLATPMFTRSEFSTGSVRLAQRFREHDETDFGHMNASYGVEVLTTAIGIIDGDWELANSSRDASSARN